MGILKGSFGSIKFNWVVGYRISACFTGNQGFQGNFFVYVWDRNEAKTPFDNPIDVTDGSTTGAAMSGTLTLNDDERNYSFPSIDLESAQVGVTRKERYRLYEFRYPTSATSATPVQTSLSNTTTLLLQQGALADTYQFSIDGDKQQLLGFRSRNQINAANAYRFTSFRGTKNSFVQNLITMNNQNANSKAFSTFTINFSQESLEVTPQKLLRAFAVESYGEMTKVPLPSMLAIASMNPASVDGNTRTPLEDYTHEKLLDISSAYQPSEGFLRPETIQSGTYVFNQGYYPTLKMT